MFERWLAQIRGQTSAAASPVAEDRMAEAVALWGGLYRGQAPWLAKGGGLELPAAIACELARQTTLELESRVDGSERARFLDGQYQAALTRLRPAFELGCATGGAGHEALSGRTGRHRGGLCRSGPLFAHRI